MNKNLPGEQYVPTKTMLIDMLKVNNACIPGSGKKALHTCSTVIIPDIPHRIKAINPAIVAEVAKILNKAYDAVADIVEGLPDSPIEGTNFLNEPLTEEEYSTSDWLYEELEDVLGHAIGNFVTQLAHHAGLTSYQEPETENIDEFPVESIQEDTGGSI